LQNMNVSRLSCANYLLSIKPLSKYRVSFTIVLFGD
jgi:hypothetical protein